MPNQSGKRRMSMSMLRSIVAPRLLIGLLVSGLFVLLLRWMASEVFEGETDAFDAAVRAAVHGTASEPLTQFFIVISIAGSAAFLTVAFLVVSALFLYFRRWRSAAILAIVMLGEIILEPALKHLYERARPEPYFGYTIPTSYSFPSGHALASVCFYGTLALILSLHIASGSARIVIWTVTILLVLLIGTSRVYLGVHYPTDVIAGYVTGTVWLTAAWIAFSRLYPYQIKKHGSE